MQNWKTGIVIGKNVLQPSRLRSLSWISRIAFYIHIYWLPLKAANIIFCLRFEVWSYFNSRREGILGCLLITQSFILTIFLFVGLSTLGIFYEFWLLSVQTFQPLNAIYRRGNFVHNHWGYTSIYWPLSYPFRSLILTISRS